VGGKLPKVDSSSPSSLSSSVRSPYKTAPQSHTERRGAMDSYLASAVATPEVLARDESDTLSKVSSHPSITPDDLDGVGVAPGAVQIEAGAQVRVAPPARRDALHACRVARSMHGRIVLAFFTP
jgi:hypothetical protein